MRLFRQAAYTLNLSFYEIEIYGRVCFILYFLLYRLRLKPISRTDSNAYSSHVNPFDKNIVDERCGGVSLHTDINSNLILRARLRCEEVEHTGWVDAGIFTVSATVSVT